MLKRNTFAPLTAGLTLAILLSACNGEPVPPQRYAQTDALIEQMKENVSATNTLSLVGDIDHSRLGGKAGSPMPPAHVLMISDPEMETGLIQLNQLAALDLPLRVLAFEPDVNAPSKVIYNSFDYLASRYQLDASQSNSLRDAYDQNVARVTAGISPELVTSFAGNEMQPDGIITIDSPYGFEETVNRVNVAIEAQDDTIQFGTVDFQADAGKLGVEIPPTYMILFGGPGPGGKAMADAPTLGLDAFCQKLLVWQDAAGRTHLSFNDLLALAERQGVPKALALRVINFRLKSVFEDALGAG